MSPVDRIVVPALWGAWLLVWIVAGLRTKPVERAESTAARWTYLAPLIVGGALLAMPRIGWGLSQRFVPRGPVTDAAAIGLLAAGLGFAIAARVYLGSNWSATVTVKQDHDLIRSGPYRWVRHPIYTGVLLAVLGTVIAVGEWRGILSFALITLSMVYKLNGEERFMTEQFGDSYRRYQAEVPALIPFWPTQAR